MSVFTGLTQYELREYAAGFRMVIIEDDLDLTEDFDLSVEELRELAESL